MKSKKIMAVILTASILMSVSSCHDKKADEVLDLAEAIANYTCDRNYKMLVKYNREGDEDLMEILEAVEDDEYKEVIASTLAFEFEESSLKKRGKNEYTVDVTFSYVDYEKVLEDEDIESFEDFEDAVDDCDDFIEEEITLEFEVDGSKIIFVNIDDLEDLFPYWYGELGGSTGPISNIQDTFYLLPETDIVFHVPAGLEESAYSSTSDPGYFMLQLHDPDSPLGDIIMIAQGANIAYDSEFALDSRYSYLETMVDTFYPDEDPEISYVDLTIGDITYEGVLATVTIDSGSTTYFYSVTIGNEDIYYDVYIQTSDLEFIEDIHQYFDVNG